MVSHLFQKADLYPSYIKSEVIAFIREISWYNLSEYMIVCQMKVVIQ